MFSGQTSCTNNCQLFERKLEKNCTLQPTAFLAALHPQQRQIFLRDLNVYLKITEGTMLSITHSSWLMNCKVIENSFVNISRRRGNRMSGRVQIAPARSGCTNYNAYFKKSAQELVHSISK